MKPNVHNRIHKPPVPFLSQINPVHVPHIPLAEDPFWFSHLCLGLQSSLFPSSFTTKTLYAPLLPQIYATWTAHLILLDLITRKLFDGKYRLSFPHYVVFPHSPATSSLPLCERQIFTPIRNHGQSYISVYFFLNRIWPVSFVPKYLNSFTLSKDLLSVFILWSRPAILILRHDHVLSFISTYF